MEITENESSGAQYMKKFIPAAQRVVGGEDAIITVTNFARSSGMRLYWIHGNETQMDNNALYNSDGFSDIESDMDVYFAEGINLFRFSGGQCVDKQNIPHFNPALLFKGVETLTIYQQYGLEPQAESDKKQLQDGLKAEKIKDTLVYACYENDNEKIMRILADDKLPKAQLNKVLHLCGTPLSLCAKNDNLQAFKALIEKGADIGRKFSGRETALWTAIIYSYDIVHYIFENHRAQFDKEVTGFIYACYTKDVRVLQLLRDLGFDMCCEGQKYPPLHTFVDYGNLVGIRFLLDQGVDIHIKNQFGQTALERAEKENKTEIAALLKNSLHET